MLYFERPIIKRTGHCKVINKFRDKYFFLSNFYPCKVKWEGFEAESSEHHFQAAKAFHRHDRINIIRCITPSAAKKLGHKVRRYKEWEEIRIGVMQQVLTAKFTQNPHLQKALLKTGDTYLEEGNNHGDTFWGTVDGYGFNVLGKLLMQVRSNIRLD